jgi:hypothetical protein
MMYMPRTFMLRSRFGATVQFVANEPVNVPQMAVDEAIQIGAVFADQQEQKVLVDEPPEIKAPSMGFQREQEIFDACVTLAEKNSPEDFTPGSKPKLDKIKAIVGYDVDRKEVNTVWQKVMSARANGA